jgi:hypothetical protein
LARRPRLWRIAGTDVLSGLFTPDATCLPSPWSQPISGLEALAVFWDEERDGADEQFSLTWEVVAVDGDVGVTRVEVTYERAATWRDLWVVRLNADGRCTAFEEWPFAPDPTRRPPVMFILRAPGRLPKFVDGWVAVSDDVELGVARRDAVVEVGGCGKVGSPIAEHDLAVVLRIGR